MEIQRIYFFSILKICSSDLARKRKKVAGGCRSTVKILEYSTKFRTDDASLSHLASPLRVVCPSQLKNHLQLASSHAISGTSVLLTDVLRHSSFVLLSVNSLNCKTVAYRIVGNLNLKILFSSFFKMLSAPLLS